MADTLKDELTIDPLTRGYSTMTDQQAADDFNTTYRSRNRISMTGSEVYNAIDEAERDTLSDIDKARMWEVLHLGTLNPFGKEKDFFITLFGAGSATIIALTLARVESITRATELKLNTVKARDVGYARSS